MPSEEVNEEPLQRRVAWYQARVKALEEAGWELIKGGLYLTERETVIEVKALAAFRAVLDSRDPFAPLSTGPGDVCE